MFKQMDEMIYVPYLCQKKKKVIYDRNQEQQAFQIFIQSNLDFLQPVEICWLTLDYAGLFCFNWIIFAVGLDVWKKLIYKSM